MELTVSATVPISVVIPTYKRESDLRKTLQQIYSCSPLPSEIIVHVDNGDTGSGAMLAKDFPLVTVISSTVTQGPGGGRNKAIAMASHEYVASFDDDSYPVQVDYFERLYRAFEMVPHAAVIESSIYHQNEPRPLEGYQFWVCHLFTGCGAAYRKSLFLNIGGYLPINPAYGIEEVDFSLKAMTMGALFIKTNWLTVFHDTQLGHHSSPKINAAAVSNTGLLVFLRYPLILWPYGFFQVLNRVVWSIKNKRYSGLVKGLFEIPVKAYRFASYRKVLPKAIISNFLRQRGLISHYELQATTIN